MGRMSNIWLPVSLLTAGFFVCVHTIGCFKCTSINHSNPECEDTFNNTGKFYMQDCWASRRGRRGIFPGTQCIKMTAKDPSINYTVVVRNCVVDDGGTNSETEIGRQSHCGWMRVLKYEGRSMEGCILSCDTDACNKGNKVVHFSKLVGFTCAVTSIMFIQALRQASLLL